MLKRLPIKDQEGSKLLNFGNQKKGANQDLQSWLNLEKKQQHEILNTLNSGDLLLKEANLITNLKTTVQNLVAVSFKMQPSSLISAEIGSPSVA